MKRILRNWMKKYLRLCTTIVLRAYTPIVIGITGSVGKTTTKQAVYVVVARKYRTRMTAKNFNNEFGAPLTVLGINPILHPAVQLCKSLYILLRALLWKDKKYPQALVLELGADHPGDIAYLTSFIPLDIGIVTSVAEVHTEFLGSIDKIADEKSYVIRNTKKGGWALLNGDDHRVAAMAAKTKAAVRTFGVTESGVNVRASDIKVQFATNQRNQSAGLLFKVAQGGSTMPVFMPHVIAGHMVYSALAAISTGLALSMNLHDIIVALETFQAPPGRLVVLPGVKHTTIIDDSYNSSPVAVDEAIKLLAHAACAPTSKRYAILGDMLELGEISEHAHTEVGTLVAKNSIDYLITVGQRSVATVRGAIAAGMDENHCFSFTDPIAAAKFVQQKIKMGDLILIKGSQGIRMEKAVKELMAEPQRAHELLVRQYRPWI